MKSEGFLANIKRTQPQLWETILKSSKEGLLIVDEENDSISPTNRLLWTYPDLHEAISVLINEWTQKEIKNTQKELFNDLISNLNKE